MPAAALLLVALSLSSLVDLTAPSSLMRAPAEGGRCRQVGAQVGEARETRGEACVFDSPSHTRREMLRLRGGKEAQDAFGKKGLEKLKKFFEEEEPTVPVQPLRHVPPSLLSTSVRVSADPVKHSSHVFCCPAHSNALQPSGFMSSPQEMSFPVHVHPQDVFAALRFSGFLYSPQDR
jgi:hypothetical protein